MNGEIFWSLFTALVAWSITVEALHAVARWWIARREAGMFKDLQERFARGEDITIDLPGGESIDPEILASIFGTRASGPQMPASGTGGADFGNYV